MNWKAAVFNLYDDDAEEKLNAFMATHPRWEWKPCGDVLILLYPESNEF